MDLLESLIKQLKQNGVQEVTFTLKFQEHDNLPVLESSPDKIKQPTQPTPQIPQEMLMGDL